tara:strand:- start:420 stop:1268 length:849 start_codon:yes stop_codon:yes gene_type:complete
MEDNKLGRKAQKELIEQGKYQCTKCVTTKNISEFSKDKTTAKGFASHCKPCKKIESKERIERRKNNRPNITEKTCGKCCETKKISEFYVYSKTIDGYNIWCAVCVSERHTEWYHNERTEELIKIAKERSSISWRKYADLGAFPSGKTISQSSKERSERYKPKRNANKVRRRLTDPHFKWKCNVMTHLKGVKKRKEFTDIWDEVYQIYVMYNIPYHIDHMVPKHWFKIETPLELVNDIDNLQVIDAKYNGSKLDRWSDPVPSEYLERIRPYIKTERLGDLISL